MNQYTSRGAGRVNAAFKVGGGYEWLCSGDNRVVVIRTLGTANYYTSLGRHCTERKGLPEETNLSAVAAFFTSTSLDGGVDPDALEEPSHLALGIR